MRIIRFSLYFTIVLALLLGPLYGAGRIILPDWIKAQIAAKLPSGSKLLIGEMFSTSKMGVLYKNIVLELADRSLIINVDELLIEPNLSISQPAKISIVKGLIKSGETEIFVKDLNASILLESIKNSELSLFGQINKIEGKERALVSNIEFLFQGLTSMEKSLNVNAEELSINLIVPEGPVSLHFSTIGLDGTFTDSVSLSMRSKGSTLDLSFLGGENPNRILNGESLLIEAELVQREHWSLPIKVSTKGLTSPLGHLGSSLTLQASGVWSHAQTEDCRLSEIISSHEKCGRMTDVVDLDLKFKSGNGSLSFSGHGYCVTPNARCPQSIQSFIKTKDTAEVLSKVIISGILNPIVGGIILGALLSTPNTESLDYDHQASIKVEGNRIYLNGKPLI